MSLKNSHRRTTNRGIVCYSDWEVGVEAPQAPAFPFDDAVRFERKGGESVAKKKAQFWFGYLEAGERSSPVVRDGALDTAKTSTIYLYNHAKGKILEYQRDIVELKLRELNTSESEIINELEAAYLQAREGFTPRGALRPKTVRQPRRKPEEPEVPDFDFGEDDLWVPAEDAGSVQSSAEVAD